MADRRVWYPDRSYSKESNSSIGTNEGDHAGDGSEESGRGSLKTRGPVGKEPEIGTTEQEQEKSLKKVITHRTPTVDASATARAVPHQVESNKMQQNQQKRVSSTYTTIESRTSDDRHGVLDCSSLSSHLCQLKSSSGHTVSYSSKRSSLLCGWTDNESLGSYCSHGRSSGNHGGADRSNLQTPADGVRSSLQSRASNSRYSSSYGQRSGHYEFRHFLKSHDYIDNYRKMYCYTTLNVPSQNALGEVQHGNGIINEDRCCEGEDVEQNTDNFLQLEVKSLYRGDPYLRELVQRLRVKEPEMPREPGQLLKIPHSTPPSIVKKRSRKDKVVGGLMVINRADEQEMEKNNTDLEVKTDSTTKNDNGTADEVSRPISRHMPTGQSMGGENASLELPKISQVAHILRQAKEKSKNKSTSSISVSKYLQVVSHNQTSPPTDREEQNGEESFEESRHMERCRDDLSAASHDNLLEPDEKSTSVNTESTEVLSQRLKNQYLECHPERDYKNMDEDLCQKEVVFHSPADGNSAKVAMGTKQQQQQLIMDLDKSQKEKMISNKAHSLGVISRGWAKVRGMYDGRYNTSKEDSLSRRQQQFESAQKSKDGTSIEQMTQYRYTLSRTSDRESTKSRTTSRIEHASRTTNNETTSKLHNRYSENSKIRTLSSTEQTDYERYRSTSATFHSSSKSSKPRKEEDIIKLEKLKNIYDSNVFSKKTSSKKLSTSRGASRCESRLTSRPGTRFAIREHNTSRLKGGKHSYSRPVTRLKGTMNSGSRMGHSAGRGRGGYDGLPVKETTKLECMEESNYWDELPKKTKMKLSLYQGQTAANDKLSSQAISLAMRFKKLTMKRMTAGTNNSSTAVAMSYRTNEGIKPGATPQDISEHLAKVKKKFEGVLDIHRHKIESH